MRKCRYLALVLLGALCLAGCSHKHVWEEATCDTAKTCKRCGDTQGEALGHLWMGSSCTLPKHCDRCEETEGEANGHTFLLATCVRPEECGVCGETRGEIVPHTGEIVGTCDKCGVAQNEELVNRINVKMTEANNYFYVKLFGIDVAVAEKLTSVNQKVYDATMKPEVLASEDALYDAVGFRTMEEIMVWMDDVVYEAMYGSRMESYDTAYTLFEKVHTLCEGHAELRGIKERIESIMRSIPRTVPEKETGRWAKYNQPLTEVLSEENGKMAYEEAISEWKKVRMAEIEKVTAVEEVKDLYTEEMDKVLKLFK